EDIRGGGLRSVGREAVIHAAAPYAGIAGGEHVNVGIADKQSLFRGTAIFIQQSLRAQWIGLLCREAVTAVDLQEKICQAERLCNLPRRIHRLVAEDGELAWRTVWIA